MERAVSVSVDGLELNADVTEPSTETHGVVMFAHGSGSSRHSKRNRAVAADLLSAGFATILLDLLTEEEDQLDRVSRSYRFDIPLLAERLVGASDWVRQQPSLGTLPLGFFGASTGAAAALIAAAQRPQSISSVVSRGGRPDLADAHLPGVKAPTLLIVGGRDPEVLGLNRQAAQRMNAVVKLKIVPGATHLFEESGALDQVATLACGWFEHYLAATSVAQ